jgi:FkbM family methyltransferase
MKSLIYKIRKHSRLRRYKIYEMGAGVSFAFFDRPENGFFFPYSHRAAYDRRQINNLSKGFTDWLFAKYTEGDVAIRDSDTVIDCGAFVGGFSVACALRGVPAVYSIEPSLKNYRCLLLNLAHHGCTAATSALNMGLGDQIGELELNLSKSGCDDSFLVPDEGDTGERQKVPVITLASLISERRIDPANLYLKVEAEGYEPEIILGLGNIQPRVVVVDVTPERDNESPRSQIRSLLEEKGYERFIDTRRCIFALH